MLIPRELSAEVLAKVDGAGFCSDCGRAYSITPMGYLKQSCDCFPQMMDRAIKAEFALLKRKASLNWLKLQGMGEESITKFVFEGFIQSRDQVAYEICKDFVANFKMIKTNLLLTSKAINGKTHLAAAIFNQVIAAGTETLFISIQKLSSCFDHKTEKISDKTLGEILDKVGQRVRLVVMDGFDLNTIEMSQRIKNTLGGILADRFYENKPTILTGRLDKDFYNDCFGGRFDAKRFWDMTEWVELRADDYQSKATDYYKGGQ